MKACRCGVVGLLVASVVIICPMPGWTDELSELQVQLTVIQEKLKAHEMEREQRRREEQQREAELKGMLQAMQERMTALSGTSHPPTAATTTPPAASSAQVFVKERPAVLDRLLGALGLHVPERSGSHALSRPGFVRQTPSERYADPSSFFMLHGYTTFTYADFQKGLDSVPGGAEQILVAGNSSRSGKHESGFRNDTALFIGSELTEHLKGFFELHLVGNARDPVITESKIVWAPFEPGEHQPSLRFVGGRYWWPFGIHNEEWFSAVNAFNLQSPGGTEVVPTHYNELGVIVEGEWALSETLGINYLASIGNGVSSFELSDNIGSANAFDADANRMFTGRLGLFPGVEDLALGVNCAAGALRRGLDTSFSASDARRFQADLIAYGVDGTYTYRDLSLRGYWYISEENLDGAPLKRLDRNGGTLDVIYTFLKQAPLLREISLKGRASTAKDATLTDGSFRVSQYGFGLNARPHEHFLLKAEYFIQDERGIDEVQNNGFTLSGTVEF